MVKSTFKEDPSRYKCLMFSTVKRMTILLPVLLSVLLQKPVAVSIRTLPRAMVEDEEARNFNDKNSEMITEVVNKSLISRTDCRRPNDRFFFRELYFHVEHQDWSVYVYDMRRTAGRCFHAKKLDNDILRGRMDLDINFQTMEISGKLECGQMSRSYVGLNSAPVEYSFKLGIGGLSCSGLCFTKWTEKEYKIKRCALEFVKPEVKALKLIAKPVDYDIPPLTKFLLGSNFTKIILEKLWRSLTDKLNADVTSVINRFVSKQSLIGFLKNPEVFQKYTNYVIESTTSANEFVDTIIGSVAKMLVEKFDDQIKIPNITEGFEHKGIFLTFRGTFKANRGNVRGLATVRRMGDTSFATDNASRTHFFGNLAFRQLDLHYDYYKAELIGLGPSGQLSTILRPIRLHIHPIVDFTSRKVYLEDFKIEDVGNLEVQLTGMGIIFDWLISKIATWVVGITRDKILDDLQKKYDDYIKSILSGYNLDDIIEGKIFTNPGGSRSAAKRP